MTQGETQKGFEISVSTRRSTFQPISLMSSGFWPVEWDGGRLFFCRAALWRELRVDLLLWGAWWSSLDVSLWRSSLHNQPVWDTAVDSYISYLPVRSWKVLLGKWDIWKSPWSRRQMSGRWWMDWWMDSDPARISFKGSLCPLHRDPLNLYSKDEVGSEWGLQVHKRKIRNVCVNWSIPIKQKDRDETL